MQRNDPGGRLARLTEKALHRLVERHGLPRGLTEEKLGPIENLSILGTRLGTSTSDENLANELSVILYRSIIRP